MNSELLVALGALGLGALGLLARLIKVWGDTVIGKLETQAAAQRENDRNTKDAKRAAQEAANHASERAALVAQLDERTAELKEARSEAFRAKVLWKDAMDQVRWLSSQPEASAAVARYEDKRFSRSQVKPGDFERLSAALSAEEAFTRADTPPRGTVQEPPL